MTLLQRLYVLMHPHYDSFFDHMVMVGIQNGAKLFILWFQDVY